MSKLNQDQSIEAQATVHFHGSNNTHRRSTCSSIQLTQVSEGKEGAVGTGVAYKVGGK